MKQELINSSNKNTNLSIPSNARTFITGKTGSGKSTLAEHLLLPVKHLIVIDGKESKRIKENWNVTDYKPSDIRLIKENKVFRIRLIDNWEDILTVLNVAFEYGNCIIYIDEVTATIPEGTKPPKIFIDLWTRGRDRGIGGWANTQRPSKIPLQFISESEQFFMFRLGLKNDIKRMSDSMGEGVERPIKDMHGFYYYNQNTDKLAYYKELKIPKSLK